MKLRELENNLRVDLGDSDPSAYEWSDDELQRTLEAAVGDLDRVAPRRRVHEVTIAPNVAGESFTTAAAHGTYVALANTQIKPKSETITNVVGTTTYTRDKDYTIDYSNGKITTISGGAMAVSTAYKASYTKSRISVDLSSLTDLVRVVSVEYPMGRVPQAEVGFHVVGSVLYITTQSGAESHSQAELTSGEHVAIHYESTNTYPTESSDGSFSRVLDQVLLKGAQAYALYVKSAKMHNHATADLVLARTEAAGIATILTAVEVALNLIATHITAAVSDLTNIQSRVNDAVVSLPKVTSSAADATAVIVSGSGHFTAAGNALAKVAARVEAAVAALGEMAAAASSGSSALGAGDTALVLSSTALADISSIIGTMNAQVVYMAAVWNDEVKPDRDTARVGLVLGGQLVNKVTEGADPAEHYRTLSEAWLATAAVGDVKRTMYVDALNAMVSELNARVGEATQRVAQASAFVESASQRIRIGESYVAVASQHNQAAESYIAEAAQHTSLIDRRIGEADRYIAIGNMWVAQAGGFLEVCGRWLETADRRLSVAAMYLNEANTRLNEIQGKVAASTQYVTIATQDVELANHLLTQAQQRYADYLRVLSDRAQWMGERVSTSTRQLRG